MRRELLHRREKLRNSRKCRGIQLVHLALSASAAVVILLALVSARRRRSTTTAASELSLRGVVGGNSYDKFAVFPQIVDLWPSEDSAATNQRTYEQYTSVLFKSCVDETKCRSSHYFFPPHEEEEEEGVNNNKKKKLRVAVVRTPGILGTALADVVQSMVEAVNLTAAATTGADYYSEIELVPTSKLHENHHQYSKILRFATLPVLLEAIDLGLQATTITTTTIGTPSYNFVLTMADILGIVRLLVQWHCHLSSTTSESEHSALLLTVSTKALLSRPPSTRLEILEFLLLASNNNDNNDVNNKGGEGSNNKQQQKLSIKDGWNVARIDAIVDRVLQRIDECTTVAMRLQQQQQWGIIPIDGLEKEAEEVVRQEMDQCELQHQQQDGASSTDGAASKDGKQQAGVRVDKTRSQQSFSDLLAGIDTTTTTSSRIVDMAQLLLSIRDENDASLLCRKLPLIRFCLEKNSKQIMQ